MPGKKDVVIQKLAVRNKLKDGIIMRLMNILVANKIKIDPELSNVIGALYYDSEIAKQMNEEIAIDDKTGTRDENPNTPE
jgi:hypothetical protein